MDYCSIIIHFIFYVIYFLHNISATVYGSNGAGQTLVNESTQRRTKRSPIFPLDNLLGGHGASTGGYGALTGGQGGQSGGYGGQIGGNGHGTMYLNKFAGMEYIFGAMGKKFRQHLDQLRKKFKHQKNMMTGYMGRGRPMQGIKKPFMTFGRPTGNKRPQSGYSRPKKKPSSGYGRPTATKSKGNPATGYGAPTKAKAETNYGAPTKAKPTSGYGAPMTKAKAKPEQPGSSSPKASSSYGAPPTKPKSGYSTPAKAKSGKSGPTEPKSGYSTLAKAKPGNSGPTTSKRMSNDNNIHWSPSSTTTKEMKPTNGYGPPKPYSLLMSINYPNNQRSSYV